MKLEDHRAAVGAELVNSAIELTGLCEVLCTQMQETIGGCDFTEAVNLACAYNCLSAIAEKIGQDLRDNSP